MASDVVGVVFSHVVLDSFVRVEFDFSGRTVDWCVGVPCTLAARPRLDFISALVYIVGCAGRPGELVHMDVRRYLKDSEVEGDLRVQASFARA